MDLRVDGVSTTITVPTTDVSVPGASVNIGAGYGPGECLDGDIAELVVAKKAISGSDTTDLEAYFKSKYGL